MTESTNPVTAIPAPATILWFRQDLRIADNPALRRALCCGAILPIYILDDVNAGLDKMGAASRWWLHQSLHQLNSTLGNSLWVFAGNPLDIIPALARKHHIAAVSWNRCYEPWRIKRDHKLKEILAADNISVSSYNASLLFEPWQVLKDDNTPYKVFTAFYRKAITLMDDPALETDSEITVTAVACHQAEDKIDKLGLMPGISWYKTLHDCWKPGEETGQQQLSDFFEKGLNNYKAGRDFPALQSVSGMSAYLHFGEISPQQIVLQLRQFANERRLELQAEHFLREIFWREFSYYLLYHFPKLTHQNLRPAFDKFPWVEDAALFQCWCQGKTGYPLIDAGMRQLWQTGYMHNRVRMIVASFLVKNLLIDWRAGARWFWDCLLDADLANNSCSWQWVAGSGADAAPYFRIFNPVTQGRKFDAQGSYVRHYVPELAGLPDKYIHNPSAAPSQVLAEADVTLGKNYPQAVVDLKVSRERALAAYKSLKDQ